MAEEDDQPGKKKQQLTPTLFEYGLIGVSLILYGTWAYRKFKCPSGGPKLSKFELKHGSKKRTKTLSKCSSDRAMIDKCSEQSIGRRHDYNEEDCRYFSDNCEYNEKKPRRIKQKFASFYEDDCREEVSNYQSKERYRKSRARDSYSDEEDEEYESARKKKSKSRQFEASNKSEITAQDCAMQLRQLNKPRKQPSSNKEEVSGVIHITPEVLEFLCKCYKQGQAIEPSKLENNIETDKWQERPNPKKDEISQNSSEYEKCEDNFYSTNLDEPYVVKDYVCKSSSTKHEPIQGENKPDSAIKKRDDFWHSSSPPPGVQRGCHHK